MKPNEKGHYVVSCGECQELPEDQRGPDHCETCRRFNNVYWCAVVKPALNEALKKRREEETP